MRDIEIIEAYYSEVVLMNRAEYESETLDSGDMDGTGYCNLFPLFRTSAKKGLFLSVEVLL